MYSQRSATLTLICLLCTHGAVGDDLSSPLSGEWATQAYSARVRIAQCTDDAVLLCGEIVWLWDPLDTDGVPLRDSHNPRMEQRKRSLIGLSILKNFRRDPLSPMSRWIDGSIYDPESGRTYRATLTRHSNDILEVEGCVLFVCRTQKWRRVDSLCSITSPKEIP